MSKRVFDLIFSSLGLLILAPVLLLLAIVIRVFDGSPVMYRQKRVGRYGREFEILKFRTMIPAAEGMGPAVTQDGDKRITRVGRFLRRTKVDELPQLWNVFKGEMSFVGPRPEVPKYMERYTEDQKEILSYTPGITDLATLLFREESALLEQAENVEEFYLKYCVPKKVRLNLEYADRANRVQDLYIILQTLCPYWVSVLFFYVLLLGTSFWLAYELRFDFSVPAEEKVRAWHLILWIVPVKLALLSWRKQFVALLSYFSIPELKQLVLALGLSALLQLVLFWSENGALTPPRSVILMDFILSVGLICGVRLWFRLVREGAIAGIGKPGRHPIRVGIIGANELGAWIAQQVGSKSGLGREVVAFFDDNPGKWQRSLCGVPIVGMPECLLDGLWRNKIDELIVANSPDSSGRLEEIFRRIRPGALKIRHLEELTYIWTHAGRPVSH